MDDRRKVKYCQWQKDTLYFAVKGADGRTSYTPLPHPSSPMFALSYDPLRKAHEERKKQKAQQRQEEPERETYITGSWRALIREYERSTAYRGLARSTLDNVDRYHRVLIAEMGDRLVAQYTAADLDRRLDEPDMADFPGRALNFIKQVKTLIDFGIRRNYRRDNFNPAKGATLPKGGEHQPWPDDVFLRVLETASPMLKMAIVLGVFTGQRISDCITIEREELLESARTGEPLFLVQQKTKVEVYIPIHPALAAAVESLPASETCSRVLYNRLGKAFPKPDQIQDRLKLLMIDLGYTREVKKGGEEKVETLYKFHGLRKLAACHLAEVGASHHEISAICGMDIQTVIHYTRGVAKKKLSRGMSDRVNTINPGQERPDLRLVA